MSPIGAAENEMRARAISGLLACLWLASACGEGEPAAPSYLFYGTITSISVDASGAWAYVRLVESGGTVEDATLYKAGCQLTGPRCDYQINRVLEGQYTVYGVIDLDGDADWDEPRPDSGDLIAPGRPLMLLSRTAMDFPDEAWRLLP